MSWLSFFNKRPKAFLGTLGTEPVVTRRTGKAKVMAKARRKAARMARRVTRRNRKH